VIPLQAALLALVAVGGTLVVLARDPLRQVFVNAAFGVALMLLFMVFQAPDVALSELVAGTVAFPFIVLVTLLRIRGPRD
jgi:energy-converting hydrogenase B subunit D